MKKTNNTINKSVLTLNKDQIRLKIITILKKYPIKHAALFGSFVTNKMTKNSDLDILIDLDSTMSLLDFVRIKIDLEENLLRHVDLVEFGTLKPQIQQTIQVENLVLS